VTAKRLFTLTRQKSLSTIKRNRNTYVGKKMRFRFAKCRRAEDIKVHKRGLTHEAEKGGGGGLKNLSPRS